MAKLSNFASVQRVIRQVEAGKVSPSKRKVKVEWKKVLEDCEAIGDVRSGQV